MIEKQGNTRRIEISKNTKKEFKKLYKKYPSKEITSNLIRIGGIMASHQVEEVEVFSFIQLVFLELERSIRKNDKLVFTKDFHNSIDWLFAFHDKEYVNEILMRYSYIITQEDEGMNDLYLRIINIFLSIERGAKG